MPTDHLQQKWPDILWIVRHGQSAGNVARDRAEAEKAEHVEIAACARDVDVPLSPLGERQAAALGRWFGAMPPEVRPTAILCSPYRRARSTTSIVLGSAGMVNEDVHLVVDERLREKEFGIFDRLTKLGVEQKYPEQAELRTALGKFYHRPPGGESWCDVILRLRSVVGTIAREYRGERVVIVGHQVIVYCMRYLLERMTEEEVLEIDRAHEVANCSVTSYEFERTEKKARLALRLFNFVAPLEAAGEEVTTTRDVPVLPK